MNFNTPTFLTNLAATCRENMMIREDGKSLTLWDRIVDLFRRKDDCDHFMSVCQKLANISSEDLSKISTKDKMEILERILHIQKRFIHSVNEGTKHDIKEFESKILQKEQINDICHDIFEDYKQSFQTRAKIKESFKALQKFDTIVQFFKEDFELLEQISSEWISFKENLSQFVKSTSQSANTLQPKDPLIVRIEKKLLDNKEIKLQISHDINDISKTNYLSQLSSVLKKEFAIFSETRTLNKQEVSQRISTLKTIMNTHANDREFIVDCLYEIDQFLASTLFLPTTAGPYLITITMKKKTY